MRLLSGAWDRILEARARRYADGRLPSGQLPRPVISVGNITVGGTGKTPLVLHIAQHFLSGGRRPAILSRGYGRRSREVMVVSSGKSNGPLVGPEQGGDEAVLLARRVPGAIVVVAPRRADAARAALAFAPDLFLLDDGYQHLSVRRDLDLLLLDVRDPFGGTEYPPFGRLREPLSAIARADAVVWTHAETGAAPPESLLAVADANPGAPQFSARILPAGFTDETGAPAALPDGPIVAVCGIALPRSFRRTLESVNVFPAAFLDFPDHHRYDAGDRVRIARAAAAAGAVTVVTTEKDAVKLGGFSGLFLRALRLSVDIAQPKFHDLLATVLPAAPGRPTPAREEGVR